MPESSKSPSLFLDNAKLLFKNFAGEERPPFTVEGDRKFSVLIEPALAKKLIAEGWRVKQLKPREEGEEGDYHLQVKLNYKKGRPPRVLLRTSGGSNELGADEVRIIDAIDIEKAELFINGWWSDMAGGGYSGFLKSAVITLAEDPLEQKYAQEFMQDAKVGVMEPEAEPAF